MKVNLDVDDGDEYQFVQISSNDDVVSIGSDLNNYGPFVAGEMVLMPKDSMRNYLVKSKGQEIKII